MVEEVYERVIMSLRLAPLITVLVAAPVVAEEKASYSTSDGKGSSVTVIEDACKTFTIPGWKQALASVGGTTQTGCWMVNGNTGIVYVLLANGWLAEIPIQAFKRDVQS